MTFCVGFSKYEIIFENYFTKHNYIWNNRFIFIRYYYNTNPFKCSTFFLFLSTYSHIFLFFKNF